MKTTDFESGALMAVSIYLNLYDNPSQAASVLNEMGLQTADCSELSVFDKLNLRKVNGERNGKIALTGLEIEGE